MLRRARPRDRGFTLIEVMVVVVIVGILATLATYGVTRYIQSAKTTEAVQVIGSIKAHQESYKSDMLEYLDVAGGKSITSSSYYPMTTPSSRLYAWGDTTSDVGKRFKQLGVHVDSGVRYAYATTAGGGADAPAGDQLPTVVVSNWPSAATGQPWYVVSAIGNLDGDGVTSHYSSASFTGLIYKENEDE